MRKGFCQVSVPGVIWQKPFVSMQPGIWTVTKIGEKIMDKKNFRRLRNWYMTAFLIICRKGQWKILRKMVRFTI